MNLQNKYELSYLYSKKNYDLGISLRIDFLDTLDDTIYESFSNVDIYEISRSCDIQILMMDFGTYFIVQYRMTKLKNLNLISEIKPHIFKFLCYSL